MLWILLGLFDEGSVDLYVSKARFLAFHWSAAPSFQGKPRVASWTHPSTGFPPPLKGLTAVPITSIC